MVSGIAISNICSGFSKITLPWNEKMITSVSKSPMTVMLLNLGRNRFSKYSCPLCLIIKTRVSMPAVNGITTNNTTDRISVSHGTLTPLTPSKNATIGVNATRIIRSFVATCTTV